MLFVKADKLKVGMRLARPIYNKNGVLLYERNSKITKQGIESVKNFRLIGIYVLEPAEPAPPMTQEDLAFERFQTMAVFAIEEELNQMIDKEKSMQLQKIASDIIRNYGRLERKVNFIQNLRSREDYIYKHVLNTAILVALLSHTMGQSFEDQVVTVKAALVCDLGLVQLERKVKEEGKTEFTQNEEILARNASYELVNRIMATDKDKQVRRVCVQAQKIKKAYDSGKKVDPIADASVNILLVCEMYDTLTAMHFQKEPASEVEAIKTLLQHEAYFPKEVVGALIKSISILGAGTTIELNNGEKGIVLVPNEKDVLRPMILAFRNNGIVDLSSRKTDPKIEIKDIMKTMDNRHIIDHETMSALGYPSYIASVIPVGEERNLTNLE